MSIYGWNDISKLMEKYSKYDNYIAYDLYDGNIIVASGCKTCIIKEIYLNEWSSGYSIRLYNKIPKKYEKVIALLEDEQEEQANELFIK